MLNIRAIHHIAIICSDYERSKHFYTEILGFCVLNEVYRRERESYKLELSVGGKYQIELFSFPSPPKRLSYPEAHGLRHLAFEVDYIDAACNGLRSRGILDEPIRVNAVSGKRFTFFADPDQLPLELYERSPRG